MKRFFSLALLLAAATAPLFAAGDGEERGGGQTGGQTTGQPASPPTPKPTTEPLLRLNTPMHFAPVRRISADAAGKLVLTASDDRTARLWDGESGELLRILRPPAGEGHEGKLYACALSADGGLAAVGGWTQAGYSGSGNHNIYLFDTATGDMVQRLSGLGDVILDLEFHSGGTLAAALGGTEGIRIWRPSSGGYPLAARDTGYGDSSHGIAFSHDGRLASVSYDGYIRLYDDDFQLAEKRRAQGGSEPYSAAFSPDGSRLAVGYADSPRVEVLDGHGLELLYRPDIAGADEPGQSIYQLAFGPGGALYGGGFYLDYIDGDWWSLARRWEDGGRGAYRDFKAAGSTIMDLKVLPDASLLAAGYQPDWGRYGPDGQKIIYKRGEIADFTNNAFEYFTLSRRGDKLSFKPLNGEAMVFSLADRSLAASGETFQPYRDSGGGVSAADWEDSYAPRVNGREADFLKQYEMNRSVDVRDDGTMLFGADWSLYALEPSGETRWRAAVPGVAWAVKISGDGRVAVSAHNGGEIRWHRMADGEHLLSLFAHPDGRRWLAWSPRGYYDASPGADNLAGWHLNRGADAAAAFYPLSRFASRFYRPEVLAGIIRHADVEVALAEAAKGGRKILPDADIAQLLPPEIAIISPSNGQEVSSGRIRVRYRVSAPPGGEVTAVRAFVDGRPAGERGLRPVGTAGEIEVPVPERDCRISLVAENRHAASEPAVVSVRWRGEEAFVVKPKLYVLAVGVSGYRDADLRLDYAAKDARDFVDSLKSQDGGLYRGVTARLLTDAQATRGDILDGLDWILRETTQKDVAMVFLAGHGVNDDYGDYYFLPQDTDRERLKRTGVPYSEIRSTVSNIAGKALFFIDSCHSGNVLGTRRGSLDINGIINQLASAENGVVVFASSSGRQFSLEDAAWNNGAFTKALVEGIRGGAAYRGDRITVNMLDLYISERVKELTGGRQTPTTAKPSTVPDFPIALK